MKHQLLGVLLLTFLLWPLSTEAAPLEVPGSSLQDSLSTLIPSTFSPNMDGINDVWLIPGISEDSNNEVWIYNRWGVLVFQQAPYNNSWKGRSSESGMGSKYLPEGTYYYVLRWKGQVLKGSIYLKK